VLELLEVMHCVLEVPEVMCCVLLCMLEALKGGICLCEVLEVMYSVLLCVLGAVGGWLRFGVSKFPLWQFSLYSPPPFTPLNRSTNIPAMTPDVHAGLVL